MMNRQTFLVCLSVLLGIQAAFAAEDQRPNIVLILCDDLGYSDVGFNGAQDIRTPNLDGLAKAGTVFTSAYVPHPFCGPSRMGMMTGRYPHAFGAPFNLPVSSYVGVDENKGVSSSEELISLILKKSGYHTGAVGKWHMGDAALYHPNARGFDEFYGFLGGGHKYFPKVYQGINKRQVRAGNTNINDYVLPLERNGEAVKETEYLTDGLSREAADFVTEQQNVTSRSFCTSPTTHRIRRLKPRTKT